MCEKDFSPVSVSFHVWVTLEFHFEHLWFLIDSQVHICGGVVAYGARLMAGSERLSPCGFDGGDAKMWRHGGVQVECSGVVWCVCVWSGVVCCVVWVLDEENYSSNSGPLERVRFLRRAPTSKNLRRRQPALLRPGRAMRCRMGLCQ